jgi:hypothetical protein
MYFIFDCNGEIVGNFKGYKTHTGAQRQCNLEAVTPTKTMGLLWARFHARAQIDSTKTRIYSIKWIAQPKSEAQKAFDNVFCDSLVLLENLSIRTE